MNTSLKNLAVLLLMLTLISGCANTKPPQIVQPVQIPPPAPELMAPLKELPWNASELLQSWTKRIETWQQWQAACKATPAECV